MEQPRVGILAYGSLIDDLGPDLTPLKVGPPVKTTTPFCVEFARSSRSRDDAPTLVPFENRRRVAAVIHEVKTTIADATNFLLLEGKTPSARIATTASIPSAQSSHCKQHPHRTVAKRSRVRHCPLHENWREHFSHASSLGFPGDSQCEAGSWGEKSA